MTSLPDLGRRLSRKIEAGKGIQLTPDDLDLLVSIGAYDVICKAIAEFQRKQCQHRSARSRSTSGGDMPSTLEKAGTTKSSGMTKNESVSEALALARQISGRPSPH